MMSDTLKEMLEHQKAFQQQIGEFCGNSPAVEMKELLLSIHEELAEILRALNYKPYRENFSHTVESNVKENIIDVFKYVLIMMNIYNMSVEEVLEEFHRKSAVVEQKWMQELDLKLEIGSVVCVDIDGVLCDLIRTWMRFLVHNGYQANDKEDLLKYTSLDFSDYLPYEYVPIYHKIKHTFRESGVKRDAFVFAEAENFLSRISEEYQIILVSARPVHLYRRLFADTIEWLRRNNLKYHGIVFEEDKRSWVLDNRDKVAFCVEDDPGQASRLASVGIKVFMLDYLYNQNVSHPNIFRVGNLSEVLKHAETFV